MAFSPDGAQVLTGSFDNTAKLWEASTGSELRTFSGHANFVWSVAFSPDGMQVLTGSLDNTAKLWDASTGSELRTFSGHTESVNSVAFSPDGTQVLTGAGDVYGVDDTAKLWDANTGTELRTFCGHVTVVWSVAFSPDGTQVLTGSEDTTVKLWDASTGMEMRTFSGNINNKTSVAFSPDGTQVLTVGDGYPGNTAKLWPTSIDTCFGLCTDEITDSDDDGLSDCVEVCNATNPDEPDTDFDELPDLWETEMGTDPRVDDAADDPDGDGATNLAEFNAGTDPFDRDSDDDGIPDGYEIDNSLNPLLDDSTLDPDDDGLDNLAEFTIGTLAQDPDTDDDLMPDGWEVDNGLNPLQNDAALDPDNDGATNLAEFNAGTNPQDPDTDDDGIPDGYELDNGLNPLVDDADLDLDEDGLTNLEEFERDTAANDPDDPPDTVFIETPKNGGSDTTGDGSEGNPFETIGFAMDFVERFTDIRSVTIQVGPGMFEEKVVFVQNVTLQGTASSGADLTEIQYFEEGAPNKDVITAAPNTVLRSLRVSLPLGATAEPTLVRIEDVIMTIEDCVLDGNFNTSPTAVLVTGLASSGSSISDSTIRNAERGVWAIDSAPNITRNSFADIRGDSVFIAFLSTKGSSPTPLLGDADDITNTGFNKFRNVDDFFIRYANVNPALTFAQFNDWGVFTEEEIREQLSVPAGKGGVEQIIITPFLGKSLLPDTLAIQLVDENTGEPVSSSISAQVTVGIITGEFDGASGLFLVTPVARGLRTVTIDADCYEPYTNEVNVDQSITAHTASLVSDGTGCGDLLVANFTGTPRQGPSPLQVQFTDASTGGGETIVSRNWDFGDDSSSSVQNPVHIYPEGVYDVTLSVSTATDEQSETKQAYIIVDNTLPPPTTGCSSGPHTTGTSKVRLGDMLTLLAAGVALSLIRRRSRA